MSEITEFKCLHCGKVRKIVSKKVKPMDRIFCDMSCNMEYRKEKSNTDSAGSMAYMLRREVKCSWKEIGMEMGHDEEQAGPNAFQVARMYALNRNLEWPIDIGHRKDVNGNYRMAYFVINSNIHEVLAELEESNDMWKLAIPAVLVDNESIKDVSEVLSVSDTYLRRKIIYCHKKIGDDASLDDKIDEITRAQEKDIKDIRFVHGMIDQGHCIADIVKTFKHDRKTIENIFKRNGVEFETVLR